MPTGFSWHTFRSYIWPLITDFLKLPLCSVYYAPGTVLSIVCKSTYFNPLKSCKIDILPSSSFTGEETERLNNLAKLGSKVRL